LGFLRLQAEEDVNDQASLTERLRWKVTGAPTERIDDAGEEDDSDP
jgi:hypothetical protein